MYVWDGLVVGFLFSWAIGLLAELQRSEVLSLDKFLHLPVSLTGVFLINYLSSLFSLTLIIFVPAMVGLSLGLVIRPGAGDAAAVAAAGGLLADGHGASRTSFRAGWRRSWSTSAAGAP